MYNSLNADMNTPRLITNKNNSRQHHDLQVLSPNQGSSPSLPPLPGVVTDTSYANTIRLLDVYAFLYKNIGFEQSVIPISEAKHTNLVSETAFLLGRDPSFQRIGDPRGPRETRLPERG